MPVSKNKLRALSNKVLATPSLVLDEAGCQFVAMPSAVPVIAEVMEAWGRRLLSRTIELRFLPGCGRRPAAARPAAIARGGALRPAHVRAAANDMWAGKTQPMQRVAWISTQPPPMKRARGAPVPDSPGEASEAETDEAGSESGADVAE